MGHSVVRTESRQNHFHSSEISPKRGTTFSRQRQFTSNKINELIHVRQRIVLKMGQTAHLPPIGSPAQVKGLFLGPRTLGRMAGLGSAAWPVSQSLPVYSDMQTIL